MGMGRREREVLLYPNIPTVIPASNSAVLTRNSSDEIMVLPPARSI